MESRILLIRFLKSRCFNAGNRVRLFQYSIPKCVQFCFLRESDFCNLTSPFEYKTTLTLGRTRAGGVGWCSPPIRFFSNFYKTNFHQHLPFSVAVGISLIHILTQVWWKSVAMVTRYDVISSRWSRHFWIKLCVFYHFRRKKHNLYAKSNKMF